MNATTAIQQMQTIQGAFSILSTLQLTAFLFPEQAQVQDGDCFDFIIVGAGSAGCVIANRLTEIKDATVLLIEAGGDPPVESVFPALFAYLRKTSVDWNFITQNDGYSEQFHKDNGTDWTRGKMLGGTSSLNFMVYTRGNCHDYDNWAEITGDESWNCKNTLPYFKKSERLVDPCLQESDAGVYHGTDGYLGTTRKYSVDGRQYLDAFKEIGHNIVMDVNGNTPVGYTESMFTIDNVRQSTAQAFLTPIKNRPNLFVLKNTLVSKVLFNDENNAIGVEAIIKNNETVTFKAKKEVIVSAGAINTPQILMLSGIGPKKNLYDLDIDVISDLPVGQALQDHVMALTIHAMGNSTTKPVDPTYFPVTNVMGYVSLDKSQGHPDYQTFNFIQTGPAGMLQFCTNYFSFKDEICDALYEGCIGRAVLLNAVYLLYPESRGKILLRSKDPRDKPIINTGYYSVDEDLDKHATYIQDYLQVQDSTFFRSVDSVMVIPEKCGCGQFNDTLEYWRCYALCMMLSGYHYASTCPMGVVVDSRLNVFGVNRLRVVDASVMPKIIGANTNAPTIMIAERAADFIKEDHGYIKNKY